MRDTLKTIYYGSISLMKTLVSLGCVILFNKYGVNRKILSFRKGMHRHNVSILASGPSANEILEKKRNLVEETDFVALNGFGYTDYFFYFKPNYYFLLDPSWFNVDHLTHQSEKGSKTYEVRNQQLKDSFMKVDWDMILFVPYTNFAKQNARFYATNSHIKLCFYHGTRIQGYSWFQNWMYKHNQGLPSSKNVLFPAMILMANLGYKKIYLYGCEFSWTKTMDIDPENGMMFFNDRHFDTKDEIRYFGKGGYKWWLETIVEDLNATEQIAKYANSIGVNIINRTKGSFIDAFPYENPDTLLEQQ